MSSPGKQRDTDVLADTFYAIFTEADVNKNCSSHFQDVNRAHN